LRPNWPMVRGIFTGNVRLDYARHRHSLWLADIEKVDLAQVAVAPEIVLPVVEAELSPELQTPPQEELLTPIEGEPAKIDGHISETK